MSGCGNCFDAFTPTQSRGRATRGCACGIGEVVDFGGEVRLHDAVFHRRVRAADYVAAELPGSRVLRSAEPGREHVELGPILHVPGQRCSFAAEGGFQVVRPEGNGGGGERRALGNEGPFFEVESPGRFEDDFGLANVELLARRDELRERDFAGRDGYPRR